ncbi:MAG: C25 family cysteine peptidase [Candidatus Hodarchaeota archaeon]
MVKFLSKKLGSASLVIIIITLVISVFFINPYIHFENLNTSDISLSTNGYPEIDLSFIPEIDYDSLNDLWYNPKVEMLIISPNRTDFIDALKPLRDWKNEKGVKTIILSNWSVYGDVDDDNATKIRKMIKSYYEKEKIRWVLLAGDAQDDLIPIRYVYNPDVIRWGNGRTESIGGEYYKPTDFYYADLTSSWDNDGFENEGDGNWGEAPEDTSHGLDEISWIPEVYVGRFPANDAYELEIMVNKTLKYETNPSFGNWTNRMLLAGGISSYSVSGVDSGEYESDLTSYIIQNYAKSVVNYTHLIKEGGNLTSSILNSYFDGGYSSVIMAGHGSPTSYFIDPLNIGYTSSDANTCSNINMPSLVYLDACSMSSYDINDESIGETLIKRMNAGAIGVIGGLRVTWYFENDENLEKLNRGNAKLFWEEFFNQKKFQQGRALYDSKVSYINSDYYTKGPGSTVYDFERKNILTYNLLGDPEVDIYTNNPKKAMNPFNENYYEGGLMSVIIKDINNSTVPYARVHFRTSDGKYFTTYANINGIAKFRLPKQVSEEYNVTITGHNLIPSFFNFSTSLDNTKPNLHEISYLPKNPSTSNMISFNIEVSDNRSGIESIYLFISSNNFTDYAYFTSSNGFLDNKSHFTFNLERLMPGDYSYFLFVRDYANNTEVFYNETFRFTIPKPIINYILPFSLVLTIGIAGFSAFAIYKGIKKHSRAIEKFE